MLSQVDRRGSELSSLLAAESTAATRGAHHGTMFVCLWGRGSSCNKATSSGYATRRSTTTGHGGSVSLSGRHTLTISAKWRRFRPLNHAAHQSPNCDGSITRLALAIKRDSLLKVSQGQNGPTVVTENGWPNWPDKCLSILAPA